eukprot:4982545-Amphidinium_carterae.2
MLLCAGRVLVLSLLGGTLDQVVEGLVDVGNERGVRKFLLSSGAKDNIVAPDSKLLSQNLCGRCERVVDVNMQDVAHV